MHLRRLHSPESLLGVGAIAVARGRGSVHLVLDVDRSEAVIVPCTVIDPTFEDVGELFPVLQLMLRLHPVE